MHSVNLTGIDLNLLVVLDALLATRSTTLSGKQLALSQPATSHALARLRELFADPLLVRSGKGLVPTPFAETLQPRLRAALETLSTTVQRRPAFEPGTSEHVFRIGAGDYDASVLVPGLAEHLARTAPRCGLFVRSVVQPELEAFERGEVELVLAPRLRATLHPSLRREELLRERFVCVLRRGHPMEKERLTLERFCTLGHVLIAPLGGSPRGAVDEALERLGRQRRVVVAVPHFLMAPLVVARTDYVLTLPARVARRLAPELGLRVCEPPVELAGFEIFMHWHARTDADPAHAFLRAALHRVARAGTHRRVPRVAERSAPRVVPSP